MTFNTYAGSQFRIVNQLLCHKISDIEDFSRFFSKMFDFSMTSITCKSICFKSVT